MKKRLKKLMTLALAAVVAVSLVPTKTAKAASPKGKATVISDEVATKKLQDVGVTDKHVIVKISSENGDENGNVEVNSSDFIALVKDGIGTLDANQSVYLTRVIDGTPYISCQNNELWENMYNGTLDIFGGYGDTNSSRDTFWVEPGEYIVTADYQWRHQARGYRIAGKAYRYGAFHFIYAGNNEVKDVSYDIYADMERDFTAADADAVGEELATLKAEGLKVVNSDAIDTKYPRASFLAEKEQYTEAFLQGMKAYGFRMVDDIDLETYKFTEEPKVEVKAEGNNKVAVKGAANVLPSNAKFETKPVTDGKIFTDAKKAVAEKIGETNKFAVVEMNLYDGSNVAVHQLGDYVEVTLPIPDGVKVSTGKTIVVYRLEDDGTMTKCETEVKDGKVTFKTNHFSTYVFVEEDVAVAATPAAKSPKTGENAMPVAAGLLALMALFAVVSKKRFA